MNAIRLIGYGIAKAKKAEEFKAGERILWNYGQTSTVICVKTETAATITFQLSDGDRKFKKTRLVAIAN